MILYKHKERGSTQERRSFFLKSDILGFAKRTGASQRKEIYNVITKSGAVFTE